jgi:hypothetical protein
VREEITQSSSKLQDKHSTNLKKNNSKDRTINNSDESIHKKEENSEESYSLRNGKTHNTRLRSGKKEPECKFFLQLL